MMIQVQEVTQEKLLQLEWQKALEELLTILRNRDHNNKVDLETIRTGCQDLARGVQNVL